MDADKSIVLRAFNKLFFEFIDDVISIYPDNVEMLTAREAFLTFKKLNPTIIAKVWYTGVYSVYKTELDAGNFDFFVEKDYKSDLPDPTTKNTQNVLSMIDKVRGPIKNMSEQNKAQVGKYVQNLNKLSSAYNSIA